MKGLILYLVFISMIFLAACNHNNEQTSEGQSSGEKSLFPQAKEDNGKMNAFDSDDAEQIGVIHPPGYGVPQVEPSKQSDYEKQSRPKINQIDKGVPFRLPFTDFKERWNELSNEQATNLGISSLEKVNAENQTFYRSFLTKNLELRVFVINDESVQKMELVNRGRASSEILDMLSGWSQIVSMLNPEAQPFEVDDLFHELGVGPNLDLTEVTEESVEHGGVRYTVIPLKSGYYFEASYPESKLE